MPSAARVGKIAVSGPRLISEYSICRSGDVHDESLVARQLGSLRVVTCAAPAYLASMGTPATLQDLDQHMFVNFFSPKTGRVFVQINEAILRHRLAFEDVPEQFVADFHIHRREEFGHRRI